MLFTVEIGGSGKKKMLKKEQNSFSLVSANIKQRRLGRLVFERETSDGVTACTSE